jgi:hypothetical protein
MIRIIALYLSVFYTFSCVQRKVKPQSAVTDDRVALFPPITCDTSCTDTLVARNYKKVLSVWLENNSRDWFLEHRQSARCETKARQVKLVPIDSSAALTCEAARKGNVFLYIPPRFYLRRNDWDYYKCILSITRSIHWQCPV